MKLSRVLFLVALVGAFAVVARADTTDTSGSVLPDPHGAYASPDPDCVLPYCAALQWNGPSSKYPVMLFFPSTSDPLYYPFGIPEAYKSEYTCSFVDNGKPEPCRTDQYFNWLLEEWIFEGFSLCLPDITKYQTFSLTTQYGPLDLYSPPDICPAGEKSCEKGLPINVDPTPEPGTGVLFVTGLLLLSLASFARRRFRAHPVVA